MKHKNILLPLFAVFFVAAQAGAQKGEARLKIGYNVALPTGSFANEIDETSLRGFNASVLYGLSDKFSVGAATGFQDFYKKTPRQLYKLSDGSDVSAVVSNSIQTIPIMVQAAYAFNPAGAVQPFAALGVGGNLISYNQLFGEFGNSGGKFGFAARPEAGVYIPFKKGGESGLTVGASYSVMPFKELGLENLNHLGFSAGVSIPLRR